MPKFPKDLLCPFLLPRQNVGSDLREASKGYTGGEGLVLGFGFDFIWLNLIPAILAVTSTIERDMYVDVFDFFCVCDVRL